MNSTSLIGQALGGAAGTKASPAQDAAKTHQKSEKERPFADYVEGAKAKPKEAMASSEGMSEPKGAAEADSAVPGTGAKTTGAAEGSEKHASAENADARSVEDAGAAVQMVVPDTVSDPVATTENSDQANADASVAVATDTQTDPVTETETAAETGLAKALPGTRTPSESALPSAEGRAIEGIAGQANGKGALQGQASVPMGGATGAEPETAPEVAQAAVETTRDVPEKGLATAMGAQRSADGAQAAAAIGEAQKRAAMRSQQGDAEATAISENRNAGRQGPEKSATLNGPATHAAKVSATPAASQSVFQMHIQNAEAGDPRRSRYRSAEGETQIAAEVSKASTAAAGINTAAAAVMRNTAASTISQAVQAVSAKLNQNTSLSGDSLAGPSLLSADLPGLPQLLTEAVFQPGATHRVEMPRMIATQLAEAFAAKGERNMDVSLNPEELGRVKMRVSTSETGIVMTIQTERPETGDLMRRHINELAEEFRRMGFQDISFEFSSGDSFGGQTGHDLGDSDSSGSGPSAAVPGVVAADAVAETQTNNLQLGSAGVDMRV